MHQKLIFFIIHQFEHRFTAFSQKSTPTLPSHSISRKQKIYGIQAYIVKNTGNKRKQILFLRYVSKIPARSCKSLHKFTYLCFYSCLYTSQELLSTGLMRAAWVLWRRSRMRVQGNWKEHESQEVWTDSDTHISNVSTYKMSLSTCSYR